MLHASSSAGVLAAWLPTPETTALAVASLLFLLGLLGTVLPLVPGGLLVWLGVVAYKLWLGDATPLPWWFVLVSGLLVLLAQAFDLACGAWGARKFGSTWRGAVGALAGGVAGFFVPPPLLWLIIGPVVGAVLGELLGGRQWREAGKAGAGTVVGALAAFAFKMAATVAIIGWFYLLAL